MEQQSPFNDISSVLIIKLRAIGDVLLATPVIENLKRQFPHLSIDFLCEQFASDVVRGNPYLHAILTFNKKSDSGMQLIQKVRKQRYDAVIDLFGNPRTALVTALSGAPLRIGFPFRGRRYAYSVHVSPRGGEVHNVDFNLDVLRKFGIPITARQPLFPIDTEADEFARQWIAAQHLTGKILIGINPSGGWSSKRWPLNHFAKLIDQIGQNTQYSVIIFWGPGEFNDAAEIQKISSVPVYCIPATTLKEMGALLKHCSYLISNDSGPMHIATSLGIPTLGIYGPTDPRLQGPYGEGNNWIRHEKLDCLACNLTQCPIGNVCMTDLSAETVYNAFLTLKEKNNIIS